MTHKEFKLIVKKVIRERSGWGVQPIIYDRGDTVIVDEATFLQLQAGKVVTRHHGSGFLDFDKYNFENEVAVVQVTVEYSIRKLGQRTSKKVA